MREGKPSRTSGVVAKGLVYTYHAYPDFGLVSSETAKWACRFLDQLEKGRLLKWHRLFKYAAARQLFRLVEGSLINWYRLTNLFSQMQLHSHSVKWPQSSSGT